MNDLVNALDDLASDAYVDRADWEDVRTRSRRSVNRVRVSRAVAVAVVLAALAAVGTAIAVGTDLLRQQERFHARTPDDPARRGPLVEITSGDGWALIAWKSEAGVCVDFAIRGNSPFSCGFPVRGAKPADDASGSGPPTHAVAGTASGGGLVGGDGKATIFGVAAREVAAVKIELRNGRLLAAPLYPAPPALGADIQFFIVRLELPPQALRGRSPVSAYTAYGADGALIERFAD